MRWTGHLHARSFLAARVAAEADRLRPGVPMDPRLGHVRAVVFDYGNTLVEFNRPQFSVCEDALAAALRARYGPFDLQRLRALRDADRLAPYRGEPPRYLENDLRAITAELVRKLFGREPAEHVVEELIDVRRRAFVETVTVEPSVKPALERLRRSVRLALVSNYPCSRSIRESVARAGLTFDVIVVSADVGHVKPHPKPFVAALDALGVEAADAVYVGDNWLADVQGARRVGMRAVWFRRWAAAEGSRPGDGDHDPNWVAENLDDIVTAVEHDA